MDGLLVTRLPLCLLLILEHIVAPLIFLRQLTLICLTRCNSADCRTVDTVPFPEGFVVSPLNTVEKCDSEERRIIVD